MMVRCGSGATDHLLPKHKPITTCTGLSQYPLKTFRRGLLNRFRKSFSESKPINDISDILWSGQTKLLRSLDNFLAIKYDFPRAACVMLREHVRDNLRILGFVRHYLTFGRASAEQRLPRAVVLLLQWPTASETDQSR